MSSVITKRSRTSRRTLLKGLTAAGSPILVGLPPLVTMFNSQALRTQPPSRLKRGSSFGSTAMAFPNAIGFQPRRALITG